MIDKISNIILKYTYIFYLIPIILPIITLYLYIQYNIFNIITIFITFILGILYYGYGRGITQGAAFQWKDGNTTNLPQFLISEIKSSKYHTFTIFESFGLISQFLNMFIMGIICGNNIMTFIYFISMLLSSFFIYYFIYARVYNYIRGRNWYNQYSVYEITLSNKIIFIKYPSKILSLFLFIIICLLLIIISII